MKRKLPARVKSELRKRLQAEVDLALLAHDIADFLDKPAGKSARGKDFANILAAYLAQKYLVTDRASGELRSLIEQHPHEVAAFLDEISLKDAYALMKAPVGHPQPKTLKELLEPLLKIPAKIQPSQNDAPLADESLRKKKRRRPRPKTEAERKRRQKEAKNRYEESRRDYRRGLIVQQFGTHALYPHEVTPMEGSCLDVLFLGGAVSKAAHAGSLEDLFGIDRHRFPKSLRGKRRQRNIEYDLPEFVECMIHLLANPDGKEQWLPEGPQRQLVLTRIIALARRYSSELGDKFAKELRRYLR